MGNEVFGVQEKIEAEVMMFRLSHLALSHSEFTEL